MNFSLDNFFNSPWNDDLMNLKIIKSPTKEPKPAIIPVKNKFCSDERINSAPVAIGDVKPYAYNTPRPKDAKYFIKLSIIVRCPERLLNIKYDRIITINKARNFGYFINNKKKK